MLLSNTCEYAIKAMVYLKTQEATPLVSLTQVTTALNSPVAFTAKVLQQLRKAELIDSKMGPGGGFRIKPDKKISILDIVTAIDGHIIFTNCILGLPECSEHHPCPLHHKYNPVRTELYKSLSTSYLEDLADSVLNEERKLK